MKLTPSWHRRLKLIYQTLSYLSILCHTLNAFGGVQADASTTSSDRSKNYASSECAKVIEANPEAKKTSHIINEMIDEYMLNPCKAKIWFVIELCEIIRATQIEIASYELYSSTPKDFTVYFSDTYPANDWKPIGHFTAADSRTLQAFELNQVGFGKFIKVEQHSNYGNEHYCVISQVKIYGASMVDEYEETEKQGHKDAIDGSNIQPSSSVGPILKRKTPAYRVYRNMMSKPHDVCGLSVDLIKRADDSRTNQTIELQPLFTIQDKPIKPILPMQPTQQPVAINRTSNLKPSIFVELSNKVKALEISLKTQIEDIERRLGERIEIERRTEIKVDKLKLQFESFALIMIAYYIYKLMLDLM